MKIFQEKLLLEAFLFDFKLSLVLRVYFVSDLRDGTFLSRKMLGNDSKSYDMSVIQFLVFFWSSGFSLERICLLRLWRFLSGRRGFRGIG